MSRFAYEVNSFWELTLFIIEPVKINKYSLGAKLRIP
jgi:hypothetical protein